MVVPPARLYTSRHVSVSDATSRSAVSNSTAEPSGEIASKITAEPLSPVVPVEIRLVTPLARSYRSWVASVSLATSASEVRKNTREPFCETALNAALKAPLPPLGPTDRCVVTPAVRS